MMTGKRLIDAEALKERIITPRANGKAIIAEWIDAQPTVEAVPVDFLKSISSRMYGKERFFRQTNGTWYDREQADYISLEEMMDRIYQQIVELDDGIDAIHVRHGKWVNDMIGVLRCSECNAQAPWRYGGDYVDCSWKANYCPNCGARMDKDE